MFWVRANWQALICCGENRAADAETDGGDQSETEMPVDTDTDPDVDTDTDIDTDTVSEQI